jgi:CBS domain-containing protein
LFFPATFIEKISKGAGLPTDSVPKELEGDVMGTEKNDATTGHLRSRIGLEMLVRDAMTTSVLSTTKYESIMNVADTLTEKHISGLPVVDKENKTIGIITQTDILSMVGVGREHTFKDLLKYMLGEPLPERRVGDLVGDIMTSPALTIKPDANIADAVRIMDEKRIRRLTVVDEKNTVIGILTRADILKAVIKKIK